jgi:hypothetical protein
MPEAAQFYLLLVVATVVVAALAIAIWKRTRSLVFPLGIGFLYYWSLAGGWVIVGGKANPSSEEHLYLYHKLFPVFLDTDYMWTLVLYAAFIIAVEMTVIHVARPIRGAADLETPDQDAVVISHARILLVSAVAGLLSFWFVEDAIQDAADMGVSAYGYVGQEAEHFSLHQVFNQTAMLPLALGAAVLMCGRDGRYLAGTGSPAIAFAYIAITAANFLLNMVLGQRGEIVVPLILVATFYLVNCRKPRWSLVGGLAAGAAAGLWIVSAARNGFSTGGTSLAAIQTAAKDMFSTVVGVETVASHFSLYGVIHKGVPLVYGLSFLLLGLSVIPRFLWVDRPSGVYDYYAQHVGAIEGQGYTIHHAAGWYLNFGPLGVILGAVLIGWIWSKLFNAMSKPFNLSGQVSRVFCSIAFATMTAKIPLFVRDGIEGYKSVALESFLMPTAILLFASISLVRVMGQPKFVGWRIAAGQSNKRALPVSN